MVPLLRGQVHVSHASIDRLVEVHLETLEANVGHMVTQLRLRLLVDHGDELFGLGARLFLPLGDALLERRQVRGVMHRLKTVAAVSILRHHPIDLHVVHRLEINLRL